MKPSRPDPVRRLVEAYEQADRLADLELAACLRLAYPRPLAHEAARAAFRRLFRQLL